MKQSLSNIFSITTRHLHMETSARLVFDNHGEILHKYMRECLVVAQNFDVVLVCSDGNVPAHQCLLALASPFLSRLLSDVSLDVSSTPSLALDDTPAMDAANLMELLYTGSTSVTDKQLKGLMKLTKVLKLKPLPVSVTTYAIIKTFTQQEVSDVSNVTNDEGSESVVKALDKPSEDEELNVHNYPEEEIIVQFENTRNTEDQDDGCDSNKKQVSRERILGDQGVRNVVKMEVTEELVEKVASKMITAESVLTQEDQLSVKFENNIRNATTDIKLCYICEAKIRGYNAFLQHLRLHQPKNGPYLCPWQDCSKSHPSGLMLHRHIGEHLGGCQPLQGKQTVSWKCGHDTCREEFYNKSALSNHRKMNHKTGQDYICNESNCDASFGGFKPFKIHMLDVHNKRPLQCDQCEQSFNDKAGLKVHQEAKHGTGRSFTCDVCGKKFSAARFMTQHRREQHEEGEKRRIKCDLCDFSSLGVRNLRKHIKTMHNENVPVFKCSYCSTTSKSKGNIIVHEKIHTGDCPFKCDVCSKTFRRNHHLKNHLVKCHTSRPSQKQCFKNSPTINDSHTATEDSMEDQEVEEMPAEYSMIEANVEPSGRIVFYPTQQIVAQYC